MGNILTIQKVNWMQYGKCVTKEPKTICLLATDYRDKLALFTFIFLNLYPKLVLLLVFKINSSFSVELGDLLPNWQMF